MSVNDERGAVMLDFVETPTAPPFSLSVRSNSPRKRTASLFLQTIVALLCICSFTTSVYSSIIVAQEPLPIEDSRADPDDHDPYWMRVPKREFTAGGIFLFIGLVWLIVVLTLGNIKREKIEKALRLEKEQFRNLVESSPYAVVMINRKGEFQYVNPKFTEMFGWTPDDTPNGEEWFRKAYPDPAYRAQVKNAWIEDLKKPRIGELRTRVFTVTCKNGSRKQIFFRPVQLADRRQLMTCEDLTETRRIQEALRESEEKYRTLIEALPHCITIFQDGKVVFANPAALVMFGYPHMNDLLGRDVMDLAVETERAFITDRYIALRLGTLDPPAHYFTRLKRSYGEEFPAEVFVNRITFSGRSAGQALVLDITERVRAEEALAAEKERLAVTLRSIGDAVISANTEGRVVLMNKAAEHLTGITQAEAVGMRIHEAGGRPFAHHSLADPVSYVLKTRGHYAARRVELALHGRSIPVSITASPIFDLRSELLGVVLVIRDIADIVRMERDMLRVEKLESLGILAGGIAHDFNNILTAVTGNLELALRESGGNPLARQRIDAATKAAARAGDLTKRLVTFSKGGAPVRAPANLKPIIAESLEISCPTHARIKCRTKIDEGLWLVEIDEGQIHQTLNNLLINAAQAMESEGTIEVVAENTTLSQDNDALLPPGDYVRLTIKDEGPGISPESASKIFDPYFTTKKTGSGLGLATAYSVVKNHKGHIRVRPGCVKGAVFEILLPATGSAMCASGVEVMDKARGRILVMDDDPLIRELAGEILKLLGYEPSFATDGAEAVRMYESAFENGSPFDAVIMDLTIPYGMGGKEALQKIAGLDPHVKAIVSSGYSNDPIMVDYRTHGFVGAIAKPYGAGDLAAVLSSALRDNPAGS